MIDVMDQGTECTGASFKRKEKPIRCFLKKNMMHGEYPTYNWVSGDEVIPYV